jgi:hypothetical protein
MSGGLPLGSEFLQLTPLGSIIAAGPRPLRLRLGYSRVMLSGCVANLPVRTRSIQVPVSEKFTVICVSTSTGSLFRM